MFKTSGGKYVAPAAIENKLKESRFIEQIVVVGSEMKFVGALIVPAFSQLMEWCKQHDYDTSSHKAMMENPNVINFYKELIDEFNQQFNHVEQIKKFELLPIEWSIETGELTPKLNSNEKSFWKNTSPTLTRSTPRPCVLSAICIRMNEEKRDFRMQSWKKWGPYLSEQTMGNRSGRL